MSEQYQMPEVHIHLHLPEFRPILIDVFDKYFCKGTVVPCCQEEPPVDNNTPCRPKCGDGCKCGGKGGCIILSKNPQFCNQM